MNHPIIPMNIETYELPSHLIHDIMVILADGSGIIDIVGYPRIDKCPFSIRFRIFT